MVSLCFARRYETDLRAAMLTPFQRRITIPRTTLMMRWTRMMSMIGWLITTVQVMLLTWRNLMSAMRILLWAAVTKMPMHQHHLSLISGSDRPVRSDDA